ncbi:NAD(P)-dependent oxidoreductase [Nocardioides sp. NPDC057577]|uniref:NAD(P)-dependent oxidoreductase n=1 Tax=Nocardioides sp. NPDC057577 TaxID=3346171 RepID=UPI00366D5543
MKLAMFGGSGFVGGPALALAAERGHDVRALMRSSNRDTPAGVDVVTGDVLDPEAAARTVAGCEAVVSTLGGWGDNDSIDLGARHVLAAMREEGITRIVFMEGFNIPFPGDPRNAGAILIDTVVRLRSPGHVRSQRRLGLMLQACVDLDWTMVRTPIVRAGDRTGRTEVGTLRMGPRDHVTTGDLAEALLDAVQDGRHLRAAPMLRSV